MRFTSGIVTTAMLFVSNATLAQTGDIELNLIVAAVDEVGTPYDSGLVTENGHPIAGGSDLSFYFLDYGPHDPIDVLFYVEATITGDPSSAGIRAIEVTVDDSGSGGVFEPAPLSLSEAFGLPFPGPDPDGRAGMFPNFRDNIGNDNHHPDNGAAGRFAIHFIAFDDGCANAAPGTTQLLYKFRYYNPFMTSDIVIATSGNTVNEYCCTPCLPSGTAPGGIIDDSTGFHPWHVIFEVLELFTFTHTRCPGDDVVVNIDRVGVREPDAGGGEPAVGGQFFLAYDTDVLSLTSASAGGAFSRLIFFDHDPIAGAIDIATGVQDGSSGVRDGNLATLRFEPIADACLELKLVRFRSHSPSTSLTDEFGRAVYFDERPLSPLTINVTPPEITCPSQITVNADAGLPTATVDPGVATAVSQCYAQPAIQGIRSDGLALDDPYPLGTTTITWTATDACSSTSNCMQDVTVLPVNDVSIDIELANVDPATMTRCITFELHDCSTMTSEQVDQEVTFTDGLASITIQVPTADYTCISAVDTLHTLARRDDDDFGIDGVVYSANFTSMGSIDDDSLIGGNLNNSTYIDIHDFGMYIGQFAIDYGSADTDCLTTSPHADLDGDGLVGSDDYTFIQLGFLRAKDPPCCDGMPTGDPILELAVEDMIDTGQPELIAADLNHDWVLDASDVIAFVTLAGIPADTDWDADGDTDVIDLLAYVQDWFAGHPATDLDSDSQLTPYDLLQYISLWFERS